MSLAKSKSSKKHVTIADPDVRLMMRVREDDIEAFELLVHRYRDQAVTVLQQMVGRREIAEDLAQDAFLRVYMARKRYVPAARFSTWFYTIVTNLALNAKRGLATRREVTGQFGELGTVRREDELQSCSPQPEECIVAMETASIIRSAIEQLGERQKQAMVLNRCHYMSYAEVASAMDITQTAVKSLLNRARRNLREILQPQFEAA